MWFGYIKKCMLTLMQASLITSVPARGAIMLIATKWSIHLSRSVVSFCLYFFVHLYLCIYALSVQHAAMLKLCVCYEWWSGVSFFDFYYIVLGGVIDPSALRTPNHPLTTASKIATPLHFCHRPHLSHVWGCIYAFSVQHAVLMINSDTTE